MAEINLKEFLSKLNNNYHILREREAKYASAAPLDLLNQIDDYKHAIELTEQAIEQDIPLDELQASFSSLNLQLDAVVFVIQEPPRKPFTGRNPYRGLRKFTQDEAEFFFGRTAATQELLDIVNNLVNTRSGRKPPGLIAVLGPSGSGKSSLVLAGLVPALHQGRLFGSEQWPIRVMVPGAHPLTALAAQFVEPTGRGLPSLRAELDMSEQVLHQLMLESLTLTNKSEEAIFVLVVDQFEELFTLCEDEVERERFLAQLLHVSLTRRSQGLVILTMRADFYNKVAVYKRLAEVITANQMLVSPMIERELREAILLPAEAVGLELDKALMETLIHDTHQASGTLPLLQYALYELFNHRDGNLLTLEAYRRLGGIQGALTHRADNVFEQLTPEQQRLARHIFLRLIQPSDDGGYIKRRATFAEILPHGLQPEKMETIVQSLADANLVVTSQSQKLDQVVIDVSHEALINEWPRLRGWLDENREAVRIRHQVSQAAGEWAKNRRTIAYLYTGARLAEAEEWAAAYDGELNRLELAFLKASVEEREAKHKHELAQVQALASEQQKRAEEQARSAKRLRRRAMILAGVSALATVAAILAIFLWIEAVSQRNQATSRELAAIAVADLDVDPERSILLALAALDIAHTAQAEDALHQALRASRIEVSFVGQDEMYGLAFSPDGTRLAAGGFDQQITIWNFNTQQAITLTEVADVLSVAFSPDGASLVAALGDGTADVWDVEAHQKLFSVAESEAAAMMAIFSPDGHQLAVSSADGTAKIWDAASGKKLVDLAGHSDIVYDIAFSPDGTRLATASGDGTAKVWDASSGQELLTFCCHTNNAGETGAFSVAFSPDGTRLATGGRDSLLKIWDLKKPDLPPRLFRDHVDTIFDVAFSLDGTRLATASFDHTAKVWDATSGEVLLTLAGHRDIVNRVAFSPGGQQLATVSSDGTARVWNIGASHDLMTLGNNPDGALSVAFSPDSQMVATAGGDGTVNLWNATSGQLIMTMPHSATVLRIAFSPDGQYLVAGQEDGQAMLWNLAVKQVSLVLAGHTDAIYDVAFSPDGRYIATASADGTAKVWQAASGEVLETLIGHTELVNSITFSPDGRLLLTASDDATAKVWDVETGQDLLTLEGHVSWVIDAAFSADGSRLATAGIDGRVIIYESTGQHLLTLPAHVGGVNSVAFSPDGTRLASAGVDGTIKVWDPASGEALLTLRGHTAPVYDLAFSPDGTRLASASADGQARLYILALDELKTLVRRRTTRSLTADECLRYLHQTQCP